MKAISNTSSLILLHAVGHLNWLAVLFEEVWVPTEVVDELAAGQAEGYPAPALEALPFIRVATPRHPPSEWLALDLGPGELAAMTLALENRAHIVLLDDALARRVALAAGLTVWGTLRLILEAKATGEIDSIVAVLDELVDAGMWLTDDIRARLLRLAGE